MQISSTIQYANCVSSDKEDLTWQAHMKERKSHYFFVHIPNTVIAPK